MEFKMDENFYNSGGRYTTTTNLVDIGYEYDTIDNIKDELKKIKENMNRKLNITMLHGCRNCGAKIDVEINKPIFHCKYCGTTYVIGTVQQNSTYQSRTDCQSYEESFCEARDCGECEYNRKENNK